MDSLSQAKALIACLLLVLLSACTSVDFEQSLAKTNQVANEFTRGDLAMATDKDQRAAAEKIAAEILTNPVEQLDAVRLALANSPALQALLAQHWADATMAAQGGRISNPVFTFERLRLADELELGRLLSFGLVDLLALRQRNQLAQAQIKQQQLRLTRSVVEHVTQVRQAWVKVVAAQQILRYAKQVSEAAEASAELARRMQAAGNFSKLQRARQQIFYADAITQLASAQHANVAARETLVRLLGLNDSQAEMLKLPDRLPDLPTTPVSSDQLAKMASVGRLDVQIAKAEFEASAVAQGLSVLSSFTDVELGIRRDSVADKTTGASGTRRGFEANIRLPIFDWGDLKRDAMNAQTLAAANRLDATTREANSNLRDSYSAYRSAFDVAKHYRDEIVPLHKLVAEENVLRYNGMLIGVFELLADARDGIASVIAAIDAEQQFWLSDAALKSSLIGLPSLSNSQARNTP